MSHHKNSHCSYCGAPFADAEWPRRCASCASVSYLNPIPVTVVLLPVDGGLLLVRRSFGATKGRLALPGGFVNAGETWQQAGARELFEETGITIAPESLSIFRVESAPDDTLLIFAAAPPLAGAGLPPFAPNDEVAERVVRDAPEELAFTLHTEAMRAWFEGR
jgi:ADP-ribose pyrophosphatase YjhB (NUDIX family)